MTSPLVDPVSAPPLSTAPVSSPVVGPRAEGLRRASKWLAGAGIVAALFAIGYLPKQRARQALAAETQQLAAAEPTVFVVKPKPAKPGRALKLPGGLKSSEQTALRARANGYVQRWFVDLGDKVERGQLLAELDTPELDSEVDQAQAGLEESRAALSEAQAARDFAQVNLNRYRALSPAGVASHSELQRAEAEAQVAEAKVAVANAARASKVANLRRLRQLKAFAKVSAPFTGTVTARKVDRGSLVTAGSSVLFELAVLEPLRAELDVPQSLALQVQAGVPAVVEVRERPGQKFAAKVTRASGTLDPATRTLRVELDVPNPERVLLPGMYADITLEVPQRTAALVLPASAVISTKDGLRAAVVDESRTVHLRPIHVLRDLGPEVEVGTGLAPNDQVVASPGPFLSDGTRVALAEAAP